MRSAPAGSPNGLTTSSASACGGLASSRWSILMFIGRPCSVATAEINPVSDRTERCEDVATSPKLLVEDGG